MTAFAYIGAALTEIAGCFAFWAWLRLDKSPVWLIPGMVSLPLFAYLLTLVEGARPDRWDMIGGAVCLCGAAIILWGPRAA